MLTLFIFTTGEAWPVVMRRSMDSTDVNQGPIPDYSRELCIYYILFVVLFSFFFLNTFVALIIVTFQEQGEKELSGCVLDKNQRACMQFVLNAKPRQRFMPSDTNGFSFKVWKIVDSKAFEVVIMILIALNAVSLAMKTHGQREEGKLILNDINIVFTTIFTIEAALKLIGYKWNYFRDSWNVFDFTIVFVTLFGVILKVSASALDYSILRLFRVFRLLKLLRQGYNIRILMWTFMQSLRALPYVVLLILIVFFIYAVIGHSQFGDIDFSKGGMRGLQSNSEYNTFDDVLQSLGVLFRCGTGESWHQVMLDCFDGAMCKNGKRECGNTVVAEFYFISFYLICAFLMLNLFVAVIMDNFDYLTRDESILGPQHMDEFVRVWSDYDPSAQGRIPHEDIYNLMCDMQPPVGFGKKCPRFLAYKRLMKLNMPISGDNTVSFTPSIFALVRTSLRLTHHESDNFRDCNFRKIIKRIWPNTTQKTLDMMMPEQTVLSGQQITIGKIYAAKLIYESFKEIKRRKNCTLPQFELFEQGEHKRGHSFLRKFMGVIRSSSQPGQMNEKQPPMRTREGLIRNTSASSQDMPVMPRRRRSNTASCNSPSTPRHSNSLNRNSTPARIRSVSSSLIIPSSRSLSQKRKSTLPYLSSTNIISNSAAVPKDDENEHSSESEGEEVLPISPMAEMYLNQIQQRHQQRTVSGEQQQQHQQQSTESEPPQQQPRQESQHQQRQQHRRSSPSPSFSPTPPQSSDDSQHPQSPPLLIHHQQQRQQPSPQHQQHQQSCAEERANTSLTNSLITALRDPAKPILCFVNPQIHQDASRTSNAESTEQDTSHDNPSSTANEAGYDISFSGNKNNGNDNNHNNHNNHNNGSNSNNNHNNNNSNNNNINNNNNNSTSSLERRHSHRSRQKRVTVSLPMIQLEIPVERDGEFMDFYSRVSTPPALHQEGEGGSNHGNQVPDLIKSLPKTTSITRCGHVTSWTSTDVMSDSGPSDGGRPELTEPRDIASVAGAGGADEGMGTSTVPCVGQVGRGGGGSANSELLRQLNNQIDKAISEGAHPRWIYQIHETEEDTWC